MVQAAVIQRIDQGLQYMLLPHHLPEYPGAPLTGQYLIAHLFSSMRASLLARRVDFCAKSPIIATSGRRDRGQKPLRRGAIGALGYVAGCDITATGIGTLFSI
ncbi:hypothetical protein MNKW57_16010 [Biformimicrobium ophioploci]|uniref:Uncharacterized protein n=1 Tax=Biformimicrobium ophioploci TaxID=3036711 RepID=A0ABQ6LYW0_9GAMM|nr:hypothetical protein MNKW57_16010 [Microbulbifer sp. NKW57]